MLAQERLKPLPVSTSTFRDIIAGDYLYVDKTKWIYKLIRYPKGAYFLARPRRFGKSLLISTLDEIFQDNRELFKGLWLYNSPYQWAQHPVIRIDFSLKKVKSARELEKTISWLLSLQAQQHQVVLEGEDHIQQFASLIFQLAAQNQVVILIDEYDNPLINNLENLEEAKRIREVLKGFYGVIKALDAQVRFVLLTGVSKFSRVGVFSDLNNLEDLTLLPTFSALLGITETEIETYCQPYLAAFAKQEGISVTALRQKIRAWYNGFCFTARCQNVYNPFSLLLLLKHRLFSNYWFASGTPTFLLKLLKARNYDLEQLEQLEIPELAFSTYELESLEVVPLLFQTGYLTIKAYQDRFQTFTLSYPNYEVKRAFMAYLLNAYSQVELAFAGSYLKQLALALLDAAWERFFLVLNTFLASINYELHIRQEKYYQTIFYLIFKLIGLEIDAEVHTSWGRIDAVIETENDIFLFEFKLDGRAEKALQQIKEKEYFSRYRLSGKTLHLLGVNFELEKRGVGEWLVEKVIRET